MLVPLLNEVIREINALDPVREAPAVQREIARNRPDILEVLLKKAPAQRREEISLLLAKGVVQVVKQIPAIIHRLIRPLQEGGTDAGTRCAVATVLAYIAQPNDLLPDDLPGGYGYIDDYVLARAALMEYLADVEGNGGDPAQLRIMSDLLPSHVVPQLQAAVDSLSTAYQIMRQLPPFVLDMMTEQIVANPLLATIDQMGTPGAFHAGPSIEQGFWGSSGAYVEGENIVVPGGPALIDGQLFIP